MLSVEELEDHVRSLTTVQSHQMSGPSRNHHEHQPDHRVLVGRNPFNPIPVTDFTSATIGDSHLTRLFSLSWEELQGGFREYLDKVVASP